MSREADDIVRRHSREWGTSSPADENKSQLRRGRDIEAKDWNDHIGLAGDGYDVAEGARRIAVSHKLGWGSGVNDYGASWVIEAPTDGKTYPIEYPGDRRRRYDPVVVIRRDGVPSGLRGQSTQVPFAKRSVATVYTHEGQYPDAASAISGEWDILAHEATHAVDPVVNSDTELRRDRPVHVMNYGEYTGLPTEQRANLGSAVSDSIRKYEEYSYHGGDMPFDEFMRSQQHGEHTENYLRSRDGVSREERLRHLINVAAHVARKRAASRAERSSYRSMPRGYSWTKDNSPANFGKRFNYEMSLRQEAEAIVARLGGSYYGVW